MCMWTTAAKESFLPQFILKKSLSTRLLNNFYHFFMEFLKVVGLGTRNNFQTNPNLVPVPGSFLTLFNTAKYGITSICTLMCKHEMMPFTYTKWYAVTSMFPITNQQMHNMQSLVKAVVCEVYIAKSLTEEYGITDCFNSTNGHRQGSKSSLQIS